MATNSRLLLGFIPWKPTLCQRNADQIAAEVKVPVTVFFGNECASECLFHRLMEKLKDAESQKECETQIVVLIRLIWAASHIQRMSLCVLRAVDESIKACERTNLLVGSVFWFRVDEKTLPAWIILHSPQSDDQSRTSTRYLLLQTYLHKVPLTPDIRDELYLACAETGFNNFFSLVRRASLSQLQTRPETHTTYYMRLSRLLRYFADQRETLTVVHTTRGFELNWFVPDMLGRLESGSVIGREFVARGQVWGLYIRIQSGRPDPGWDVVLSILKPSQNNLEGDVHASFRVSPHEKRKMFSRVSKVFDLHWDHLETSDLPVEGDMPKTQAGWPLSGSTVDNCCQYINKDGSCYLMFDVVILPPVIVTVEFEKFKP